MFWFFFSRLVFVKWNTPKNFMLPAWLALLIKTRQLHSAYFCRQLFIVLLAIRWIAKDGQTYRQTNIVKLLRIDVRLRMDWLLEIHMQRYDTVDHNWQTTGELAEVNGNVLVCHATKFWVNLNTTMHEKTKNQKKGKKAAFGCKQKDVNLAVFFFLRKKFFVEFKLSLNGF